MHYYWRKNPGAADQNGRRRRAVLSGLAAQVDCTACFHEHHSCPQCLKRSQATEIIDPGPTEDFTDRCVEWANKDRPRGQGALQLGFGADDLRL